MCKAANELGGPLRCGADARRRWLSSDEAVHHLERCHSEVRSALDQTSPETAVSGHSRDSGMRSERSKRQQKEML